MDFLRLHQRQRFEQFVQSSYPARHGDNGFRQIGKPKLSREKIMKFKGQTSRYVGIGKLLKGQRNIQTDI